MRTRTKGRYIGGVHDTSAPTGVWVHLLISIIFRFSNWYCWWNSKHRYSKDTPLVFVTIASVASLVTGIIANLLSFIIQALRLSTHLIVTVREIVFVDSICNVCISCITCNRCCWWILKEITLPGRPTHWSLFLIEFWIITRSILLTYLLCFHTINLSEGNPSNEYVGTEYPLRRGRYQRWKIV